MKLKIFHESDGPQTYQALPSYSSGKFNGYLLNNNPITFEPREYVLEVEGLPYSYDPNHPKHKEWTNFLKDNPHVISNFDTRDPCKLEYLFERWQLVHNNG